MKKVLLGLVVVVALIAGTASVDRSAAMDSATIGCPGQLNAGQAQAGDRAALVAAARAAAEAEGLNFGDVQSAFNQLFCLDGCPGQLNADQAQAGDRAELVAEARAAAEAAGLNFGDIQSAFNQFFCGDGGSG